MGIEDAPATRKVLTTGEVAKLLGVTSHTVAKLFDSGRLRGFRIPSGRDRRIPIGCLRTFCVDNGLPTDKVDQLWTGLTQSPE